MQKRYLLLLVKFQSKITVGYGNLKARVREFIADESGDVPGWVLVVLMTTGLVTAIWTVAQPRISSILRNSLDNMNNIR